MVEIKYKKYEAYKDSGVEWLGGIPEGWTIHRFRNIFTFRKGLNITKENLQETGIPCVNYGEIHSKYGFEVNPQKNELKCVSDEYVKFSPKSLLQYGDVIFADTSEDIEGSGNFTYLNSNETVFAGYHTVIAKPKDEFRERYTAYLFDSTSFRNQIRRKIKGVKVYSITNSILKDTLLWLPPSNVRQAIANFLDNKTSKIDKAIAQKEKMIVLLKERKQIIIQNAVTGKVSNYDLNDGHEDYDLKEGNQSQSKIKVNQKISENHSSRPMKDSGVEWIGEIPEGWEVKRIKHILKKSFSGGTPSTDKIDYWDGGLPWISSVDVKKDILTETAREISHKGLVNSSSNIAPKGALVFVTRSGILQHTFAISELAKDMAINQDIKCLIFSELVNTSYFKMLIKGNNSEILVETRQQAATVESINMEAFYNLFIPLPPIIEQNQIVTYIETQSTKIDKAIALQQAQIDKLKEYKATLIDSAVTGKIKVS